MLDGDFSGAAILAYLFAFLIIAWILKVIYDIVTSYRNKDK